MSSFDLGYPTVEEKKGREPCDIQLSEATHSALHQTRAHPLWLPEGLLKPWYGLIPFPYIICIFPGKDTECTHGKLYLQSLLVTREVAVCLVSSMGRVLGRGQVLSLLFSFLGWRT